MPVHRGGTASREAVLVDTREGRQRVDQTDVPAFRRLDRADTAVVVGFTSRLPEAGALAGQTALAQGRDATLVRDPDSGLVWSMNCDSCDDRRTPSSAEIGFELIQVVRHQGFAGLAQTPP